MFTVCLLVKSQKSGSTPAPPAAANAAGAAAATAAAADAAGRAFAADAAGRDAAAKATGEGCCCYFFVTNKRRFVGMEWGECVCVCVSVCEGRGCCGIVGENGGCRVRGLIPLRRMVPTRICFNLNSKCRS